MVDPTTQIILNKYFQQIFFLLSLPFLARGNFFNKKSFRASFRGHAHISIGSSNKFSDYSVIQSGIARNSIVIGNNNLFEEFSVIFSQQGTVKLGDNNFIGPGVRIQGEGGVVVGSNNMIAANSFISSSNHDVSNPFHAGYLRNEIGATVVIEDFVWIGANCVVTSGVTIGHHSVVGAGSVVTKHVASYTMVAGAPAKVIKKFCPDKKMWITVR